MADGLQNYCKSCVLAYSLLNKESKKKNQTKYFKEHTTYYKEKGKEYRKKDPKEIENRRLLYNYNITLEKKQEMLISQNEVCAICSNRCSTGRNLAVDHCHKTGKIRGLLCHSCNTLLGKAKDDIIILKNAILYLEKEEIA